MDRSQRGWGRFKRKSGRNGKRERRWSKSRVGKGVKQARSQGWLEGEEAGEGLQGMVGKDGWQGRSTRKDGKEKAKGKSQRR